MNKNYSPKDFFRHVPFSFLKRYFVEKGVLAEIDLTEKTEDTLNLLYQAWIDLDLARRNVQLAKDEVTSAEEDQRLFHTRYLVGKSIALEDFDATVKMFQARLALLEAIYKYRLAQARLTFASGGI